LARWGGGAKDLLFARAPAADFGAVHRKFCLSAARWKDCASSASRPVLNIRERFEHAASSKGEGTTQAMHYQASGERRAFC
jgi:hypothetical protein